MSLVLARCALSSIAIALIATGFVTSARAAPIAMPGLPGVTLTIEPDNVNNLQFILSGGQFTTDAASTSGILDEGDFWSVNILSVVLDEAAGLIDNVTVTGTVQHREDLTPDKHHPPAGDLISFVAKLRGNAKEEMKLDSVTQTLIEDGSWQKDKNHDGHTDKYTFGVQEITGASHINSWQVVVTGEHPVVPEPSTAVLLGCGLASMGVIRRLRA